MIDFEEALKRLQADQGVDRGTAVRLMKDAWRANDPELKNVNNVGANLAKEYIESGAERVGTGILGAFTEPFDWAAKQVGKLDPMIGAPGGGTYPSDEGVKRPSEYLAQHVHTTTPRVKGAEGVGGIIGSAPEFVATEGALSEAVPMIGTGLIRRAAAGGIIGGLQSGTTEGAEEGAAVAAVLPPAIEAASGLLAKGLGVVGRTLFGRAIPHEMLPEIEQTSPPEAAPKVGEGTIIGVTPAPGLAHSTEAPLQPPTGPSPLPEGFVGTANVTTGQPFKGEHTVLLDDNRGRVFVNANHVQANLGEPTPVDLANPAVFKVGDQPYRDALAQVFPNNPKLLELYDTTERPEVLAREVLGRFAQRKGFDSVILKSADPAGDLILDFKDFEKSSQPGLGRGVAGGVTLAEPKKAIFASKVFPDDIDKQEYTEQLKVQGAIGETPVYSPFKEDPFVKAKAIKYGGKVYKGAEGDYINFHHNDIAVANDLPDQRNFDATDGFIGHDDKFIRAADLDKKVATYVRRYGFPARGEKINFSELGGGFASKPLTDVQYKEIGLEPPTFLQRWFEEDPERAARSIGFKSTDEMEASIRAARLSPMEMFQASGKTQYTKPPPIEEEPTQLAKAWGIKTKTGFKVEPRFREAVQAITNRHPLLMRDISKITVGPMPKGYEGATAITTARYYKPPPSRGGRPIVNIDMHFNEEYMPGQSKAEAYAKFRGITSQEYQVAVLEHELTHVAQYWVDKAGLGKTLGTPAMIGPKASADTTPKGPVESQAYPREYAMEDFFRKHRALQDKVNQVPGEIRARVLARDGEVSQRASRAIVQRKYNKLKGEPTVKIWASKAPTFTPDDMDAYDSDSRGLFDTQFDPDKLLDPAIKDMFVKMEEYGLKGGAGFRRPFAVTDDPNHISFIGKVYDIMNWRQKTIDSFNKHLGNIFKDVPKAEYDQTWEAVEGLKMNPDGTLTQTMQGLPDHIAKRAVEIRQRITDRGFELVHGFDRRAPAILAKLQLPDTELQWKRIQAIQLGNPVKNPRLNEFAAAREMAGMLHFDESHDLSGKYVDGYITHQPIANEKAELLNQIQQHDRLAQMSGITDPAAQAVRNERIKRLTEIELQHYQQKIRSLPSSDIVRQHHFFGPMNAIDHPGLSTEMIVDKNIPHILGRYVNGLVSKRAFDRVLFELSKVAPDLSPTVREYDVNYVNNMRGVRGFKEDMQIVNAVNDMNKFLGRDKRISIKDVRDYTRFWMQFNNAAKLYINQVRFPLIQGSHVALTLGVVDPKGAKLGLAYMLAKPKQAVLEAMAQGVVDKDPGFLGALDEIKPTTSGRLLKYAGALQKYPDYFRKTVTYHGMYLRALEPGFKRNPIIRTVGDILPGENRIQYARRYARGAVDILQFRLRSEGKPQAFVGGAHRRLWGQFKQWPINIGGLYADIIKSGDKGMIARLAGALFMFGGLSMGTGDLIMNGLSSKPSPGPIIPNILFDGVRGELLKHGIALPKLAGWQLVANLMGLGESLDYVNIATLQDVIGVPRNLEDLPSYIAGPTFGGIYDFGMAAARAGGDPGKQVKAGLSALSPQIRAGIDAYEEFKHGGVTDPAGRMLAMRSPTAIVIRGLDLSPSVATQRLQYKNDITTAFQAGQWQTGRDLLKEAQSKGIVFGPKDMQTIKSAVKQDARRRAIIGKEGFDALVR